MRILHLARTVTAYAPARFVDLINRYTEHEAKLIQLIPFWLGNPLNIEIINTETGIREALDWADILHFHGSQFFDKRCIIVNSIKIKLNDYFLKPYILHYHGSPHRENAGKFQRAVPLLLSTPEMLPLFEKSGGQFFPNLIDETSNLYIQRQRRDDEKLCISHHYSLHRKIKNTDDFLRAEQYFKQNSNSLLFRYIKAKSLVETLSERAVVDIVFDHLQGYYGLVSIEGMTQSLAVLNGASNYTMNQLQEFLGSKPPFLRTSKRQLLNTLQNLTHEKVDEFGKKGRKFMETVWSGKKNIQRLIGIYQKL